MANIRIGIADDHNLFREGIRMIVSGMEDITLTLEAESGRHMLELLKTTPIDVLLLDIEMKDINGMDLLRQLPVSGSRPRVIILSMYTEPRMMTHMLELGANGYLRKDVKKEELEEAIRIVYHKGMYLNETLSKSLMEGLKKSNRPQYGHELSSREQEVLRLICEEYTTQQISEILFISDRTVEGHRKNLCLKLEAKNTAGLVKKALLLNLVGNDR